MNCGNAQGAGGWKEVVNSALYCPKECFDQPRHGFGCRDKCPYSHRTKQKWHMKGYPSKQAHIKGIVESEWLAVLRIISRAEKT